VRAYLLALGLTTFFVGLPLLFAGYVRIGCAVSQSDGSTVYSNCGGANGLELVGGALIIVALFFFVASFVPNNQSRYK
jgi:hypothetical protein